MLSSPPFCSYLFLSHLSTPSARRTLILSINLCAMTVVASSNPNQSFATQNLMILAPQHEAVPRRNTARIEYLVATTIPSPSTHSSSESLREFPCRHRLRAQHIDQLQPRIMPCSQVTTPAGGDQLILTHTTTTARSSKHITMKTIGMSTIQVTTLQITIMAA